MTSTEELLALAEAATPGPWIEGGRGLDNLDENGLPIEYDAVYPADDEQENDCIARDVIHDDCKFIAAANPETIKQLVELCRLQNAVLKVSCTSPENMIRYHEAIAAYNRFEQGGE